MPITRLSTTDAFLVVDLDGAPRAVGTVRMAKKILRDGAELLARARTYQHALLEQQVAGASAGINAVGEAAAEALAAFVAEAPTLAAGTEVLLEPGKGTDAATVAPLLAGAPPVFASRATLRGIGAAAAGGAALGGWDGRTVAIEQLDETGLAFLAAARRDGARLVAVGTPAGTVRAGEGGLEPEAVVAAASDAATLGDLGTLDTSTPPLACVADVVAPSSRTGVVDHDVAAALEARLVVPLGWAPVTARGLAVARRAGTEVLPDFLTLAGEAFALVADADATEESVGAVAAAAIASLTAEVVGHTEGAYLGACARAEAYLSTWQTSLPFGRPLA